MTWKQNPGYCPPDAAGKRVKVRLRDGSVEGEKPVSDQSPAGWRADEKSRGNGPPANWSLSGFPFDIIEYEVHGQ